MSQAKHNLKRYIKEINSILTEVFCNLAYAAS